MVSNLSKADLLDFDAEVFFGDSQISAVSHSTNVNPIFSQVREPELSFDTSTESQTYVAPKLHHIQPFHSMPVDLDPIMNSIEETACPPSRSAVNNRPFVLDEIPLNNLGPAPVDSSNAVSGTSILPRKLLDYTDDELLFKMATKLKDENFILLVERMEEIATNAKK